MYYEKVDEVSNLKAAVSKLEDDCKGHLTAIDNLRVIVRQVEEDCSEHLTVIDNLRFIRRQLEFERNGLLEVVGGQHNSIVFLHELYDEATKTIEMYRETISGLHRELTDKDEKIHMYQRRLDFYESGDV
jgi:chromosome segregation ATPase